MQPGVRLPAYIDRAIGDHQFGPPAPWKGCRQRGATTTWTAFTTPCRGHATSVRSTRRVRCAATHRTCKWPQVAACPHRVDGFVNCCFLGTVLARGESETPVSRMGIPEVAALVSLGGTTPGRMGCRRREAVAGLECTCRAFAPLAWPEL